MRRRAVLPIALAATLLASAAHADQYKSEARVTQGSGSAVQQDLATQLKGTTDPYARALLLRELAGQAANAKDLEAAANYLEQADRHRRAVGTCGRRDARLARPLARRQG